ncbi:MAG: DUF2520 domain-containing protein [Deltaproteobacteria bacterium]|nr:DUF2520 domain-containing protein [Deltaproteobacteria bacterium]RLB95542.1 MAG: DUF2520 domain-containing protein [Deltaproteobacteria bacterium]
MKPQIAIVGCGRVGTALAVWLHRAGYPVCGLSSRRLQSAEAVAALIGPRPCSQAPQTVTAEADVVFITTPDGVIETVCRQIAAAGGFRAGSVVLHCSGALPSTILAPARQSGAWIGSLHPLQSFAAPPLDRNPFAGIIVSVEGDGPALQTAEALAADLNAHPQQILTEAKALYHAAAVVASNYLVTLLDLAFTLLQQAGVAPRDAHGVLRPLIDGTLANVARIGPPAALTGPVARGDAETVVGHLEAIGAKNPESLALYRALGMATVDVAERGGHLDAAQTEHLRRLMEP